MLLCLDVGNTHILGGVFEKNNLKLRFRYATHLIGTADQFGIFLLNILHANKIVIEDLEATALSSVVPSCDYTIKHTISLYLKTPLFIIQPGVKTGLNIRCKHASEVGADRIANAIGAIDAFAHQNLIIIDMGTATTVDVITKSKDYLGGAILPGLRLGMESLRSNTAKLMEVDIETPKTYIGKTTKESIQTGLYYTHLGGLREIIHGTREEVFRHEKVVVIGTGGFSQLFKDKNLFDVILPDLVLHGLLCAYQFSGI